MKKIYYYTYVVIPINPSYKFFGKVYFGKHKTDNLDDGYICSSSIIGLWCIKHPNEYIKLILNYYDSEEELNEAEYNLIHPHLNKPYCLNMVEGGNQHSPSLALRKKLSDKLKGVPKSEEFKENLRRIYKGRQVAPQTEEARRKMSLAKKGKPSIFKGKKHTEEAKEKNRLAHLGKSHSHPCPFKGKHRVYDNKELNIYNYE